MIAKAIFILFFSLLLCSCGYQELNQQAPAINLIKKNQKFYIPLPEDHRLGEVWQLSKDFNNQLMEEIGPVWHGNEKGVYFNLKALASGQSTLNFTKRKFQDTVESRRYIVKITEP